MFVFVLGCATGAALDVLYHSRAGDAGVEQAVLADAQNLSRDEVLAIVVEREAQGRR